MRGRVRDEGGLCADLAPEFGIFREESIPGMQRVAACAARNFHQFVNPKITFSRGSGAYPVHFIGQADMQRRAVRVTKNGGGGDAHLAASSRDPHGDFPAIGDEDFAEHLFFQTSNSEQDSSTAGKRDVRGYKGGEIPRSRQTNSRLVSMASSAASFKLRRASARVRPCVFTPGISLMVATYHFPRFSIIAVNCRSMAIPCNNSLSRSAR